MDPGMVTVPAFFRGQLYALMGDAERSQTHFDSARIILEPLIEERPGDDRLHAALGRVYAALGRNSDAIESGRRAADLVPLSYDAMSGSRRLVDLSEIFAMVGEADTAIDILQQVLVIPSMMTVHRLRLDPTWDSIRDDPRFQALLEQYGN